MLKKRGLATILAAILLSASVTATLSGCGFQLRGSNGEADLPFKTIYIALPAGSSLGAELKRYIRSGTGTQVTDDQKAAQATLEILSENKEKLILSLNSQGRISEYSLYYRLNFHVKSDNGKELLAPTEILLRRDMSFNYSQVLAKESEEALLYRDMQTDAVQQILRRLTAVKPA